MNVLVSYLPSTITLVLTAILTFLAVTYLYGKSAQNSRYPPGPFPFPIIGNLPQIAMCGSIDVFFEKYRKIYGNVSAKVTMIAYNVVTNVCIYIFIEGKMKPNVG